jgi:hypothetical protein
MLRGFILVPESEHHHLLVGIAQVALDGIR